MGINYTTKWVDVGMVRVEEMDEVMNIVILFTFGNCRIEIVTK